MKAKHIVIAVAAFLVSMGITIAVGLLLFGGNNIDEQIREQLRLGQRYLSEMKYEEAIAAFNKAIELDPKNAEAYVGLADVYAENGRLEEALEVLENVPEDVDAPDEIEEKLGEIRQLADEQKRENAENETTASAVETTVVETMEEETTDEEITAAVEVTRSVFVLWSEAGLEDHVMDWKDEVLEVRMREITGISDRDIMFSDVWEMTELNLDAYERDDKIETIDALAELTNLTRLDLSFNQISDITPLSHLTSLTWLDLMGSQINDITPLSNLTSLIVLNLCDNRIADITPLSNLTSLTMLILCKNQITDITPLSHLTSLTELALYENQITDITPLANLTSLTRLDLDNNQISDVTPLANLIQLEQLELYGNPITDYSPVEFVRSRDY